MSGEVDATVAEIFRLCRALAQQTGRPVVPDGHMVGAVGEAFVDRIKELDPAPPSTKGYDATEKHGKKRQVQIKTTTANRIALRGTACSDDLLLAAVSLDKRSGKCSLCYYGPISAAWDIAGDRVKPGQWTISIRQLAAHHANTIDQVS